VMPLSLTPVRDGVNTRRACVLSGSPDASASRSLAIAIAWLGRVGGMLSSHPGLGGWWTAEAKQRRLIRAVTDGITARAGITAGMEISMGQS